MNLKNPEVKIELLIWGMYNGSYPHAFMTLKALLKRTVH